MTRGNVWLQVTSMLAAAIVCAPVLTAAAQPAAPAETATKSLWAGPFLQLQVGYGTHGGDAGPVIPDPKTHIFNGGFSTWKGLGCPTPAASCYDDAVTTARGDGLTAALQFGYNILGWASIWADLSWKGSFGSKVEMAGTGTVSMMAGFHPLRAWRPDAPFDAKLYVGYGFFDILYYYEAEFQQEVKGKAWTGSAIPFGLSGEWRVPGSSLALGLDLRWVRAAYDTWIYNNDKDISSDTAANPVTTFRFEPRLTFAWHL